MAATLAALHVDRGDYENDQLLARVGLNSNSTIDFEEFRFMINKNLEVVKALDSLTIEEVLATFMPKGSADDVNKSQIKTSVLSCDWLHSSSF